MGALWDKIKDAALAAVKPLGKKLAIAAIQREGDRLQKEVRESFLSKGVVKLDSHFDGWQARLEGWVTACRFIPQSFKEKLAEVIKEEGDKLQAKVREAAENGGPQAIDQAFDLAQAKLIERIERL